MLVSVSVISMILVNLACAKVRKAIMPTSIYSYNPASPFDVSRPISLSLSTGASPTASCHSLSSCCLEPRIRSELYFASFPR